MLRAAVVPGYYLVCYNSCALHERQYIAVVPGYYLVCYNLLLLQIGSMVAVVPGYYLVCYNFNKDYGTNWKL